MWVQEGADLQDLLGPVSGNELGRIFSKWVFLNLLGPSQLKITTSTPFQTKNLDIASKGLCSINWKIYAPYVMIHTFDKGSEILF